LQLFVTGSLSAGLAWCGLGLSAATGLTLAVTLSCAFAFAGILRQAGDKVCALAHIPFGDVVFNRVGIIVFNQAPQ
jgi:hypothetical protein